MKPLKVKKSEIKTCDCAYLYEDGHLVMVHKKHIRQANTEVQWVTIYENVGITCQFEGRLIIDPSALPFILMSKRITASVPCVTHGSDNTKRLNIKTGSIILYNGIDHRGWIISYMPELISSDVRLQSDSAETFDEVKEISTWCIHSIKNVYQVN